jgi:tetratricopeptide (TPR) repeat protein
MTFFAVLLLAVAQAPPEPEPIVIPPPAPVHGLVVDEDGRPVEGAELFHHGVPEDLKLTKRASWTGRSDAQGRFVADRSSFWLAGFSFVASTESITAFRTGLRPTVVKIGRSGTSPANPIRIVLRPVAATGVSLRVVDPDGAPVAGAKIVHGRGNTGLASLAESVVDRLSVATGPDGRVNLSPFSPEDVTYVTIVSKAFGSQIYGTDPTAKGEQTLTLRAVGRLSGRVVVKAPEKADGLNVMGMTVSGPTNGASRIAGLYEATVNSDGRFEVPALAVGPLTIVVSEGRANLLQDRSQPKPVQVVAGKLAEVEVEMKAGVPVRGVLRERGSQRPIMGATVRLDANGNSFLFARTDRSGRFKGFILPGNLHMTLLKAGSYVLVKEPPRELGTPSAEGGEIDLGVFEVVRGVDVRGVVRDELGKPVAGAEIACRTASDGNSIFAGRFTSTLTPVSDDRGEFVIENQEPAISLEVTARVGEAATATPTVVTPGETRDLTLVVSPANTVSLGGRVVDEYGKPIAGAVVRIRSRWKTSTGAEATASSYSPFGTSRIVTDAEGRFQIPKTLHRHAQHQAEATAPGRIGNPTEWFASTTFSFFDLTLFPNPPPEQAQIRADYDAGWAADRIGDFAEAEARFRSGLKGASELKITDPLTLSWWHAGLARVLIDRGDYAAGETEARLALELSEKALPADHLELARLLRVCADACMRQRKFEETETLLSKASAILDRRIGPDPSVLAQAMFGSKASFSLKARPGPDQAGRDRPTVEPAAPQPPTPTAGPPDHPDRGWLLFDYGYLAIVRDRNADAVPLLERAYRVLETSFGPDSPELIPSLINLGHAWSMLERFDQAEPIFRRVTILAEKVDGIGAPRTVDARERLTDVLRKQGKDAEADGLVTPPRRKPDP